MQEAIEQAPMKYKTAANFAESYIKGNEFTKGDPSPEWAGLLKAAIEVMTKYGYDAEDVLGCLQDDLKIIDDLLETEYTTQ